jgi:hypothetical protein
MRMSENRLRLLENGKFKQVKLELSQKELLELIVDLKILRYLHEQLEFTVIDSDPELTIVFQMKSKISLLQKFRKYSIYIFTLFVGILRLLGIIFLIYSTFDILRGMIHGGL